MLKKILTVTLLALVLALPACLASAPTQYLTALEWGYGRVGWNYSPEAPNIEGKFIKIGADGESAFYIPKDYTPLILPDGSPIDTAGQTQFMFYQDSRFYRATLRLANGGGQQVYDALVGLYGDPGTSSRGLPYWRKNNFLVAMYITGKTDTFIITNMDTLTEVYSAMGLDANAEFPAY